MKKTRTVKAGEAVTSFASIARMVSQARIERGVKLLTSDATGWTVDELIKELRSMPKTAKVLIYSSNADEFPDPLFSLHLVGEDDGGVQVEIQATFRAE
jgi:hypothetical protein